MMKGLLRRSGAAARSVAGWYVSPIGLVSLIVILVGIVVGVFTEFAMAAAITSGLVFAGLIMPYKFERDRAIAASRSEQLESLIVTRAGSQQRALARTEGTLTNQIARLRQSINRMDADDRQDLLIGEVSSLLDDVVLVREELHALADGQSGLTANISAFTAEHADLSARVEAANETASSALAEIEKRISAEASVVEVVAPSTTQLLRASQIPLVFAINPGRSGSLYLERLLLSAVGAIGEHEHQPQMIGKYLRLVEAQGTVNTMRERYFKVHAIEAAIANSDAADLSAYVDTSNMFVKTFADVVTDYFDHRRIKVLHLRRNVLDTARSFRQLGFFTDANPSAIDWTFDVRTAHSLAARYRAVDNDDPCSLIVGYLVETELRGLEFRANYPRIQVIDIRLEELQDLTAVEALFGQLGLRSDYRLAQAVARPVNQKKLAKNERHVELDEGFSTRVLTELGHYLDAGAPIGALLGAPVVSAATKPHPDGVAEIVRPAAASAE